MGALDNFKKEAKRWLKAARAGDAEAHARLARWYPAARVALSLRDVQHALAREHGHDSWASLKDAVSTGRRVEMPALPHEELVRTFLEFACWDHRTHGKGDHRMHDHAAQRFLAQHPALASASLYCAAVCGNVEDVRRRLAERPASASQPGGSRGWTPLLYLSYARFTHRATIENALDVARLLIDHGASPNDFYMAGDSEYSCLVGAAGEGEQDAPRQPYAESLYALLLERGAGPYDIQVLYNTHFSGDMIWWLELTYQQSLVRGLKADWDDPDWSMLDMGGYGSGAFFVLKVAVERNRRELAEWALTHGASPNSDTSANPKFKPRHTLYQMAVMMGQIEIAELLARHGATVTVPAVKPLEEFITLCMSLDRTGAAAFLERHPEYRRSHLPMFEAAKRDRADVIALLLELGVPLEISDEGNTRALHHAAAHNALRAARFLIEQGAEIDPRESAYGATPIGWAAHGDRAEMMDFLSQHTRNIWTLVFRGYVDRVRELLREDPDLATQAHTDGTTPLWWLPDDEGKAMELVDLLLAAGADPAKRNTAGRTAADWALRRGMVDVARRLSAAGGIAAMATPEVLPPPPAAKKPLDMSAYEALARDLLSAYNTGETASIQRLGDHFGQQVTWEEIRTIVPRQLAQLGLSEDEARTLDRDQACMLIARGSGFDDWAALERATSGRTSPATPSIIVPPPDGSGAPIEMRAGFIMRLHDNVAVPTADVWRILVACRNGDLEEARALIDAQPSLVRSDYNYMPPLHLAVREGHLEVVRFLAERGAVNTNYLTYPYNETLITIASDRGYAAIVELLQAHWIVDPDRPAEETGHIEYEIDLERRRFQRLVGANAFTAVQRALEKRPELATDPFAFWSEGVLMMPANRGNREMLDLLMRYGARVPDVSKWGASYYFKRDDIAVFLMDRGMNPNHMNIHRTTLLHEMARLGDVKKTTLLLDKGAAIDAVDDEFRSTPLGVAARWNKPDTVRLLLDRGADRRTGAEWATPLEWARRKGHAAIAAILR